MNTISFTDAGFGNGGGGNDLYKIAFISIVFYAITRLALIANI
jgi:hypothetical protein